MKALILCAVILLTCTQFARASPSIEDDNEIPDDETLADNALNEDDMVEVRQEVLKAIQALNDKDNEDDATAVEADEEDDYEEEMDIDMMEKTLGIEIPICAQYAELTYPLHLSHLTDCRKFYKCSNGRGYLFDCPAGEHWSVKLDRCDYPEISQCTLNGMHQYKLKKVAIKKASDDGGEVNSANDDEHDPNGDFEVDPRCDGGDPYKPLHFSHPKDCSKFYKCYMGKAYVIKCPKGQHWGQRLNRCEHPTLARCSLVRPASVVAASLVVPYMDIPEKKKTIVDDPDFMVRDSRCLTAEANDRFKAVHFAHPSDCQMFYKCFNRLAYKVSCPLGLHYNEKTKDCDYPEIANCQATVDIQSAQHNIEMSALPDCSHGQNVNFGIQGSITRYFQCLNGEAYLRECPHQEFFNVNIMKCDHLPNDPRENNNNNHVRLPQWPSFSPYTPNYGNNYYQSPMWWSMNSNYPNWQQQQQQYPMYQPIMPHKEEQQQQQQEHRVPAKPVLKAPEAAPRVPELHIPQAPVINQQQQQPSPEFPSWLPQLNTNINRPQIPAKPSKPVVHENMNNSDGGFDFMRGQHSSRCPRVDDPINPVHLSHETSCTKFYKCFQQRAFLLECPNEQEWSDELQRCDYHTFANCDPIELAKRKMKH